MKIIAIFCLIVALFCVAPAFAGSMQTTPTDETAFVPTQVANQVIPLQLKGSAGKNQAAIQAVLADFTSNCGFIKIISYEVQIHKGSVTGLKVRYAQS